MGKLVQFWVDRNAPTRFGSLWSIIILGIRNMVYLVCSSVGFSTMSKAAVLNDVYIFFIVLQIIAGLVLIIGIGAEIYERKVNG